MLIDFHPITIRLPPFLFIFLLRYIIYDRLNDIGMFETTNMSYQRGNTQGDDLNTQQQQNKHGKR
jgi:hypothetical protein